MLINYYTMISSYSFIKNKIILVPQRIFILILFKYFDYEYDRIEFSIVADLFEQFKVQR